MSLLALALNASAARAALIDTFEQIGTSVVLTGSGTLLVAGGGPVDTRPGMNPGFSQLLSGAVDGTGQSSNVGIYYVAIRGSSNFGDKVGSRPTRSSGDSVGIFANRSSNALLLPFDYVSGAGLVTSSTYDNATFMSLGLVPGTYVYSYRSGSDLDTFTIRVGSVPLPATAPMFGAALLALGAAGLSLMRKAPPTPQTSR